MLLNISSVTILIVFVTRTVPFKRPSCGDQTKIVDPLQFSAGVLTDPKGRRIQTYQWSPSGQVTALVFISHGYAEHLSPYYDQVALEGAKRGFLSFGHDHVGHGLSEGSRVQAEDMSDYVDPIIYHCTLMVERYPGVPLFILGHSMGGLIALLSVIKTQAVHLFAGMVLTGPSIKLDPAVATPLNVLLASVLSRVLPEFALSGIDVRDVTSDKFWQEVKECDPLHHQGGFKALHSQVLLDALKDLETKYVQVRTPYLILHGALDTLSSTEGSIQFYKQTPVYDKTLIIVPGALHNLYLERDRIKDKAIMDTMDWIKHRALIHNTE